MFDHSAGHGMQTYVAYRGYAASFCWISFSFLLGSVLSLKVYNYVRLVAIIL
jgi:hypothetical protein